MVVKIIIFIYGLFFDLYMLENFLKNVGVKEPYPTGSANNPYFDQFARNIEHCARCPKSVEIALRFSAEDDRYSEDDVLCYKIPFFRKLYEETIEHRDSYSGSISDDVVLLVHPAYLFYALPEKTANGLKSQAEEYLDRLVRLLTGRKDDVSVVVLDTIHHYAAFSSILLENGLVDDVFFTHYNSGFVPEDEGLDTLESKTLYVAGGLNNECFTNIYMQFAWRFGESFLYAVPDLVVNNPNKNGMIDVLPIYSSFDVPLDSRRHVPLSRLTVNG